MTDSLETNGRPHYLPDGIPGPSFDADGLQESFWSALQREELVIQRCRNCSTWIFAPEWICHQCHSFDLDWTAVAPIGVIHSWTRIWHPVMPALADRVPYVAVVVELPQAGGIKLIGNLLGDPRNSVEIGAQVEGVFEHHAGGNDDYPAKPFTLLQWARVA